MLGRRGRGDPARRRHPLSSRREERDAGGKVVDWMEKVGDEQYGAGLSPLKP
jgi:hypothetical protein